MTHDELREKVARALVRNEGGDEDDEWPLWLSEADAALAAVREALREPSEEMKAAGEQALSPWIAPAMHSGKAWSAMLAASPLSDPRA